MLYLCVGVGFFIEATKLAAEMAPLNFIMKTTSLPVTTTDVLGYHWVSFLYL